MAILPAAIARAAGDGIDPRHGPIPPSAALALALDGSELVRLGHANDPGDYYAPAAAIAALGYSRLFSTPAAVSLVANNLEQSFLSVILPGGLLVQNGQLIRLRAFGNFLASTAHNRTIRGYFGSSILVAPTETTSGTPIPWRLEMEVVRISPTSQFYSAQMIVGNPTLLTVSTKTFSGTTGTEDLTKPVTVALTGQVTGTVSAGDIVCNFATVEFVP